MNDGKGNAQSTGQPKEIGRELESMNNAIAVATQVISEMGVQLEPVMSENPLPQGDAILCEKDDVCAMAANLRALTHRIGLLSSSITSYTDRLEL